LASLTDRIAVLITADGDQAVREFNKVAKSASNTGRDVESRLTSGVNNALKKVGVQSEVTGAAVKQVGTLIATAFATTAVEAVRRSVDQFVTLTDEVRNFQRTSGASAQESSKFVAVLDDLGVSASDGAAAMFRLGKNIAAGGEKLKAVGVDAARNADGTVSLTESLLNVADAYARTSDPAKRADIAFQAFGKSGASLIPILEQGRQGLATFFAGVKPGQVFSDKDLQRAMDYKLAVDDLADSVQVLERRLGEAAAGPLADFTAGLSAVLDKLDSNRSVLGRFFDALGNDPQIKALTTIPRWILNIGHAQVEANRSTRQQSDLVRQQAQEYQQLTSDVSDAADEFFKLAGLQDRAASTQDKINQLQSDIADLPAQHARDLADAQDAATSAAERLRDATSGLSDAQARLRDINSGESARKFAADLASAQADLAEAKSKLQRAIDTGQSPNTIASLQADVGQAQVKVDETSGAKAKAVAQANDDIASAQRSVRDASKEAADAQGHLNDVRKQDVSKEIESKQRDLNAAIFDEAQLRGQIAEQSGGLRAKLLAEKAVFDQYGISVGDLNDQLDRLSKWQQDHPGTDTGGSRPVSDRLGFTGGQPLTGMPAATSAPAPTVPQGPTTPSATPAYNPGNTTINITGPSSPDAVVKAINENEYLIRQGRPF
jgi:hypothetical protein